MRCWREASSRVSPYPFLSFKEPGAINRFRLFFHLSSAEMLHRVLVEVLRGRKRRALQADRVFWRTQVAVSAGGRTDVKLAAEGGSGGGAPTAAAHGEGIRRKWGTARCRLFRRAASGLWFRNVD